MWLPPSLQLPLQLIRIALSFNGRTSDSDSLNRGSNPWGATMTYSKCIFTNILVREDVRVSAQAQKTCCVLIYRASDAALA